MAAAKEGPREAGRCKVGSQTTRPVCPLRREGSRQPSNTDITAAAHHPAGGPQQPGHGYPAGPKREPQRRWKARGATLRQQLQGLDLSLTLAEPRLLDQLGGGGAPGAAAQLVSCLYATDVTHGSLDLSMAQERAQYGPTEADGGWDGHDCAGGLSKGEPGCGEACADGSRARRRRRNTRLSVVLVPDDTE